MWNGFQFYLVVIFLFHMYFLYCFILLVCHVLNCKLWFLMSSLFPVSDFVLYMVPVWVRFFFMLLVDFPFVSHFSSCSVHLLRVCVFSASFSFHLCNYCTFNVQWTDICPCAEAPPLDMSLQTEALCIGNGNGQFVFELLPVSVRGQTDLVKAGVRDG